MAGKRRIVTANETAQPKTVAVHCAFDAMEKTAALKPNPKNPNRHPSSQVDLIAKVIASDGWRHPITVSERSGCIVAGHGRLLAAQKLGLSEVPVDYQPFASEQEELAALVADNRLAELAELCLPDVRDILLELDTGEMDMEMTGWSEEEMERLMTDYPTDGNEPSDAEPQIDRAEELNKKWKVKTGDLWTIGKHRLLCADGTDESILQKIKTQETQTLVFDPEWNDFPKTFIQSEFILAFCDASSMLNVIQLYGPANYIFCWDCVTCWYTPNRPLKRMKCCIFYGDITKYNCDGAHYGESGPDRIITNTRGTYQYKSDPRGKHLSDIYQRQITKEHADHLHFHSKPLEWIEMLIANCTTGNVIDPFLGSGTTMVACEKLKRRCFGIEISSAYCAVILERMKTAFPNIEIKRES